VLFIINVLVIGISGYYLYLKNGVNIVGNAITINVIDEILTGLSFCLVIISLGFIGFWISMKRFQKMMPMMFINVPFNPLFLISMTLNIITIAISGYLFYCVINSQVYDWNYILDILKNPICKVVYGISIFFGLIMNLLYTLCLKLDSIGIGNSDMSAEEENQNFY